MDEKSIEQEQIATWIRELDAEFCRLPLPRGVHAVIQNGMNELVNKVKHILGERKEE